MGSVCRHTADTRASPGPPDTPPTQGVSGPARGRVAMCVALPYLPVPFPMGSADGKLGEVGGGVEPDF